MDSLPPSILADFCAEQLGSPCHTGTPMPGGGSQRDFFRLVLLDGRRVVGVVGHDLSEVQAFLLMTRHLASRGIPVPALLAEDPARGVYAMEDLGDRTLAAALGRWRQEGNAGADQARLALENVVRWLPVIQIRGGRDLPYDALVRCGALAEGAALDGAVFRGDLRRFMDQFLPRFAPKAAVPGPGVALEMEALVVRLDDLPREHFCYRDFQARNIMWVQRVGYHSPEPVFLDYQSGRPGALPYDLASLLYSPDTRADDDLREHLLGVYLDALRAEGVVLPREDFLTSFRPMLLVRRLQALGAYAELGAVRGKPGYLEQIPSAVAELGELLREGRFDLGLPALEGWLRDVMGEAGGRD